MIHNERMKYGALFGWGIAIYAVLSLVWSGFVIYGFAQGMLPRLTEFVLLLALSFVAGRSLRFVSWKDVLPYSVTWGIEAVLLDAIYSVPFSGWTLYANPALWFGYAIVVCVPLLTTLFRREPELPAHLTT
jgi:hypothetical protein